MSLEKRWRDIKKRTSQNPTPAMNLTDFESMAVR